MKNWLAFWSFRRKHWTKKKCDHNRDAWFACKESPKAKQFPQHFKTGLIDDANIKTTTTLTNIISDSHMIILIRPLTTWFHLTKAKRKMYFTVAHLSLDLITWIVYTHPIANAKLLTHHHSIRNGPTWNLHDYKK